MVDVDILAGIRKDIYGILVPTILGPIASDKSFSEQILKNKEKQFN
jgi:hypothetical protein